jgi:hypothetical protein
MMHLIRYAWDAITTDWFHCLRVAVTWWALGTLVVVFVGFHGVMIDPSDWIRAAAWGGPLAAFAALGWYRYGPEGPRGP